MNAEGKRPFWAECKSCNHRWAAAYLPMPLDVFAQLLLGTKMCPHCGAGADQLAISRQKDGVLPGRKLNAMVFPRACEGVLVRKKLKALHELWKLPLQMRRHFIAQFGKCSLCGAALPLHLPRGDQFYLSTGAVTWDHTKSKASGGAGHDGRNLTLAHNGCNFDKGAREPYACEVLFCIFTNEIVERMRPPA